MGRSVQLKMRGISMAIGDDLQETWKQIDADDKITNTAGDIFTKFLSAVDNIFQYLIGLFNNILPPETRDDQIHHWFHVAKPYLIAAALLITFLCCLPCIAALIRGLFSCVCALVSGFFFIVASIFRGIWLCIGSIFRGIWRCVGSIFRWLWRCLCCGGRKMMKAPGRAASMKLLRGSFEANPRGYFLDLRGKPNNFVF